MRNICNIFINVNRVLLADYEKRMNLEGKFVEALSYKIDAKCDFRQTCGRYFILVPKDKVDEAIKVITTDWLNQFVVKYSDESYNNETYFEPVSIY